MGVINVTPDSFSDGGAFADGDTAVKHGLQMLAAGADLIDVGGESTRPGAPRVSPDEERRRVEPVVRALAAAGAVVSIDTMRASTAQAALDAGARIVNDVSGGLADPDLPRLVAEARVPYVVMHWRGHSQDMQSKAVYGDVVGEVVAELRARVDAVVAAGVDADAVILDPDAPRPMLERDDATAAVTAIAALHGAWGVRVHDVRSNADAVRVAAAVRAAR